MDSSVDIRFLSKYCFRPILPIKLDLKGYWF